MKNSCVVEMYHFCKQRGLSEVWAYMWSSWYSPQMWKLWAQSSDGCILSHLQTTIMGENHWKQLKHHHLGFMHHPQLDQSIYIMLMEVVPIAITKSETLDGSMHLGAAVELTMYQKELKSSWKDQSHHELGCHGSYHVPKRVMWSSNFRTTLYIVVQSEEAFSSDWISTWVPPALSTPW